MKKESLCPSGTYRHSEAVQMSTQGSLAPGHSRWWWRLPAGRSRGCSCTEWRSPPGASDQTGTGWSVPRGQDLNSTWLKEKWQMSQQKWALRRCSSDSMEIEGLALFAEGGQRAPGKVQLTREGVLSHQVITGVALVGDPRSPHQRDVGSCLPAVLDLGQVRAGVVSGHLWKKERKENTQWLMTPSRCCYCLSARLGTLTCFLYRCSHESHGEKKINSIACASDIGHWPIFGVRRRSLRRKIDGLIARSLDRVTEWWICSAPGSIQIWSTRPVRFHSGSGRNQPQRNSNKLPGVCSSRSQLVAATVGIFISVCSPAFPEFARWFSHPAMNAGG